MNYTKNTILIFTLLAFGLWSCDDDPTGPNLDEAPDTPSLENVGMDLSIFDNALNASKSDLNDIKALTFDNIQLLADEFGAMGEIDEIFTPYEQAGIFANTAEIWFQTMGQFPNIFFQQHQWDDPEMDGNTWVWEWSYQIEGESAAFVITADEVNNERHWEMRVTFQGTDNDVENALFIASQVDLNGQHGSWQMFDFDDDLEPQPTFEMEYELDGDITTSLQMRFADSDDEVIRYNRDGAISSLHSFDVIENGESLISWNNEEGYGFLETPGYQEGNRSCWNTEFESTDCGDLPEF